jgi:hypothetical protein
MTPQFFLDHIIRPALVAIGLDGPDAERLLLGTALQESALRNYRQEGGGPALGYFQMEPEDHDDIWANFLLGRKDLAARLRALLPARVQPSADQLIPYPHYAAAMCRVHYLRVPAPIPTDLAGQAAYYKIYYNTPEGAATTAEYLANWQAAMDTVTA